MRRFHLPALGGLLASVGTVAGYLVKHPEIVASVPGKLGAFVAIAAPVVLSVTKPLKKSDH